MRVYSKRERVLFAILATLIFLPIALFVSYLVAIDRSMRTISTISGLIAGWGGVILFWKIALTGTSTRFFELPAGQALGLQDNSASSPPRSNEEL